MPLGQALHGEAAFELGGEPPTEPRRLPKRRVSARREPFHPLCPSIQILKISFENTNPASSDQAIAAVGRNPRSMNEHQSAK